MSRPRLARGGGDEPLDPFTRERIARLAEAALRRADVAGVFPTPLDAVQRAVGVRERLEMSKLPDPVRAKKPSSLKRWLGAYWYQERTVFIDVDQPPPRVVFTDAHETVHAMCPWHEAVLRMDTEDELFRQVYAGIEAEANFGAGVFIFQGGRFHRNALQDQVSIRVPLALSSTYGASRHATLHYYVQEHPDAVALLIAGRYVDPDGTLPVWRSVESQEYLRKYGRFAEALPAGQLKAVDGPGAPLAGILDACKLTIDPPSTIVGIPDKGGTPRPFVAEAFFNQHCHFVFVAEQRATRLGQRVRLAG